MTSGTQEQTAVKLLKTDRRFSLHSHGFKYYVEFDTSQWGQYWRFLKKCEKILGSVYIYNGKNKIQSGNWAQSRHIKRYQYSSKTFYRVFLKNKTHYTLILLHGEEK